MRKTSSFNNVSNSLSVDTRGLQAILNCGRGTATEIGTRAGARIKVGRRVLWNVTKVQNYINSLSDQEAEA